MNPNNLFDLRRIIAGVFVLYGVTLAILGLFENQAAIDKAAGVNINLWAGAGMLVFGLLMLTWSLARPLEPDETPHPPPPPPPGP